MSREIKFRMWSGKVKKYFYDSDNVYGCLQNSKVEEWAKDYEDMVWQQYTGLKDKNGKEIYEGDIVKFDDSEISRISKESIKGCAEVIWCEDLTLVDAPCWGLWFIKPVTGFYRYMLGDVEVIGNIFEK